MLLSKAISNCLLQQTGLRRFAIKVGDKFPQAVVAVVKYEGGEGFSNEIVDINEYFENKNIVLIGFPGAFTPTCMMQHIPQFIQKADELKAKGADEVIAMSVNDPFVTIAFAELLGGRNKVNFIADGNGELTQALGMDMDLTPVQLGPIRSKRFTMIVKNNSVTQVNSEEGAQFTEKSCAAKILDQITPLKHI